MRSGSPQRLVVKKSPGSRTWLWKVTSLADKRIIELNQQGVSSRFYEPGPYTPMEQHTRRFVEWVLNELQ